MRSIVTTLTVCLLMMLACTSRRTDSSTDLDSQTIACIHETLGLDYPYVLESVKYYEDGGSYGGLIRGSKGTRLEFAWDGRFDNALAGEPRVAYVGTQYPATPGAQPLPTGSRKEGALMDALQICAEDRIPRAVQDSVLSVGYDYMDCPFFGGKQVTSLTDERGRAILALRIVWLIKRQRMAMGVPDTAGCAGRRDTVD